MGLDRNLDPHPRDVMERFAIFATSEPVVTEMDGISGPHQRPRIHLLVGYSSPSAYTSHVGMGFNRNLCSHPPDVMERFAFLVTLMALLDENRHLKGVTNDLEYTYSSPSAYTSIVGMGINQAVRNENSKFTRKSQILEFLIEANTLANETLIPSMESRFFVFGADSSNSPREAYAAKWNWVSLKGRIYFPVDLKILNSQPNSTH
ncbi:hypothetical protein ONZ45_g13862 [Pleurotus djamor]|nr:hypothetical protein ONZ45_g13862 [Pleurotus djamor]